MTWFKLEFWVGGKIIECEMGAAYQRLQKVNKIAFIGQTRQWALVKLISYI